MFWNSLLNNIFQVSLALYLSQLHSIACTENLLLQAYKNLLLSFAGLASKPWYIQPKQSATKYSWSNYSKGVLAKLHTLWFHLSVLKLQYSEKYTESIASSTLEKMDKLTQNVIKIQIVCFFCFSIVFFEGWTLRGIDSEGSIEVRDLSNSKNLLRILLIWK